MADWRSLQVRAQDACQRVFGEAVVYEPLGRSVDAFTIAEAIYDAPHEEVQLGDGVRYGMTAPRLHVRASDLSVEVQTRQDYVTVRGTRYLVVDEQRDEGPGVVLTLQLP